MEDKEHWGLLSSGRPCPGSGRGAVLGSGEKQLRRWAEQKGGRKPGREGRLPGLRGRHHPQRYPHCINTTANGYPYLIDAAQGGWTPGPKHPEDCGWKLSLRQAPAVREGEGCKCSLKSIEGEGGGEQRLIQDGGDTCIPMADSY